MRKFLKLFLFGILVLFLGCSSSEEMEKVNREPVQELSIEEKENLDKENKEIALKELLCDRVSMYSLESCLQMARDNHPSFYKEFCFSDYEPETGECLDEYGHLR